MAVFVVMNSIKSDPNQIEIAFREVVFKWHASQCERLSSIGFGFDCARSFAHHCVRGK